MNAQFIQICTYLKEAEAADLFMTDGPIIFPMIFNFLSS